MKNKALLEEISALTSEIAKLPKGYISKKTVGGKVYYYHQWSENGQKHSRYLHDDEIEPLSLQIERKKALRTQLQELKAVVTVCGGEQLTDDIPMEVSKTNYTFMHKQIPVADIEVDEETGFIQKINTIYAPEHLPIGITIKNGMADRKQFNDWWIDRSIPQSRSGVREALEALDIASTQTLLVKCYGLSLSDHYWICPKGSGLTWEAVNYFDNDFSNDIGNVLFGEARGGNALNLSSPDNTSDGNLKKRWRITDEKRCLVKGGSNPFRQQPFNEVIATGILERLGIDHVPYTLAWDKNAPYSICDDFITTNTELVPAWRIYQSERKPNHLSVYQHFVNCCQKLGVDPVPFLDRMIVFDYIIANEDRHLNNFGLLRDPETLQWIGMAPIFDSGSSLGYDKLPMQIRTDRDVVCKPFKNHHEEQLKLVTDFSWIDFKKLSDVGGLITEVLTSEGAETYMDEIRIRVIVASVERRIANLQGLAMANTISNTDSTDDDVKEDIAEDYTPKMTL